MIITIQRSRTLFHRHRRVLLAILLADFFLMAALYGNLLPFRMSGGSSKNIRSHFLRELNWFDSLFGDQDLAVDLHLEDSVLGHTGRTIGHRNVVRNSSNTTVIAIGMGITSKGVADQKEEKIATSFQLFYTFLPSFCNTTSAEYEYAFYLAYDQTDNAFSRASFQRAFQTTFYANIKQNCVQGLKVSLHMVQCRHAGKPTWAQNDAMMEAYLDNVDYHYRINDDTVLQTNEWAKQFIRTLSNYDPPNIGVVGPTHSGGNTAIMTYDFVHRTHVDVMGFYYPRLFTDWWGDDWVTRVYLPHRSTKLETVRLAHTMSMGQRYDTTWAVGKKLEAQLVIDIETLNRFINSTRRNNSNTPDGSYTVSMSLFGADPKYTWGAIRNAQLMPIYFLAWRLRVYIPDPESFSAKKDPSLIVPERIVIKLRQLGADIIRVRIPPTEIPPRYWRYLVTDDQSVDYFLIRDVDSRLSERDAVVVQEWIQSNRVKSQSSSSVREISVHCIRDHPKHTDTSIVDGLWGGNGQVFREAFQGKSMKELLRQHFVIMSSETSVVSSEQTTSTPLNRTRTSQTFLSDVIWPVVSATSLCHDGMSCHKRWSSAIKLSRVRNEYLGQEFNAHNEVTSEDGLLVADLDCYGCIKILETTTHMRTTTKKILETTTHVPTTSRTTTSRH